MTIKTVAMIVKVLSSLATLCALGSTVPETLGALGSTFPETLGGLGSTV